MPPVSQATGITLNYPIKGFLITSAWKTVDTTYNPPTRLNFFAKDLGNYYPELFKQTINSREENIPLMLLNDNPVIRPEHFRSCFPWETDHGSVNSYDLMNSQSMTDPTTSMVDDMDTHAEANVEIENSTPEGADEGQFGDQGGDADGANFGWDEGSEDTMAAEGEGTSRYEGSYGCRTWSHSLRTHQCSQDVKL